MSLRAATTGRLKELGRGVGTVESVPVTTAETLREPQAQIAVLAVATAVAAAIVVWLLVSDHRNAQPANVAVGPVLVSAAQLTSESKSLGHPIYWAGPRSNWSYELTVTDSGRIYVRYLPRGAAAGDARADFLTVGTYPGIHAYENLKRVSTGPKVHSNLLSEGGLLVAPKRLPKSVYLAYPRQDYQVEVYDGSTGAARRLVLNGLIGPVG
jgi:hypothetical protein